MLSRELKLGIIGGVISSILVIVFIQPILSFVWEAIISFGESVQAGYVDRIYKNAAIGERNLSGNLLLLVLAIILLSYPLFILLKEYANRYEINDLMSSLINIVISFLILMLSALIMVFLITHDPQPASRADMASEGLPRLHAQGEIVNILLKIKNSFLPTKQILIGL